MNKTKRQQLHNQKLITNYDIIHDNWFYDNFILLIWLIQK